MQQREYNLSDKYSIEEYAQKMVGKTFRDICFNDGDNDSSLQPNYNESHENRNRKGGLGQLIEERFFHYQANSESRPDFEEAGVELKTTPYRINQNRTLAAKERLVLNMIDYNAVISEEDFFESHFWYKNEWILLVYYLWMEEIENRLDYRIDYVRLFTPNESDLNIIKNDYHKIIEKIQQGKAHELSESDTMYLAACTKSADSRKRTEQPCSAIPAKPRAFSYKSSYMSYVLNNYIIGGRPLFESIIKNDVVNDFEEYVIGKINKYRGKTFKELCAIFDIKLEGKPKALGSMLAFRMLGISGNNAEEFVKANIQVKTIRINKKGTINESMSFPTFNFQTLVNEEWEDSDFYNLLSSTKFLFVVYQEEDNGQFHLDHAQFWNIPNDVLDNEVRPVWEKTKYVLTHLPSKLKENGHYVGIFPKQAENRICHVRPHARDSRDTMTLPDGRVYPKQCFWLNRSYILSIVNE